MARDLQPQKVEPAPKAPPVQPTTRPQAQQPAGDLLAYLEESGTPPDNLKPARALLKEKPAATAEEAYRCLEAVDTSLGSLRKAGKWIWGDAFEPAAAVLQAPGEEIERLRLELAQTIEHLKTARAEKVGAAARITLLEDQVKDLSRQNASLKMAQPRPEPATAAR